jgi:hypothetical protein
MKTYRTIVFALLISIAGLINAQIHFGVKAGINNSCTSFSGKMLPNGIEADKMPTFHSYLVGGFADIDLFENVTLQPNLIITGKGAKMTTAFTANKVEYSTTYLEVPVYLNYKSDEIDGFKVICAIGPYMGMGLSGKIKNTDIQGHETSETIKWGDTNSSHLKSIDFGLSFVLGWEVKYGIQILINYNIGINNLAPRFKLLSDNLKIRDNSVGISLGYIIK